ncbi:unnamed protein product [Urochloa humidicola]
MPNSHAGPSTPSTNENVFHYFPPSSACSPTVLVTASSSSSAPSAAAANSVVEEAAAAAAVSVAQQAGSVSDALRHYGRCYWELSKARLSALVVATSGAGHVLGSGNNVDIAGLCCTCAGTMMVAASANTLNQVFEIKNDAKMKRTMRRPLPRGLRVLELQEQLCWPGRWAAASTELSLNSVILPAALYYWQIPHFMALAYLCRNDYLAGGYRMFSFADPTGKRTAWVSLRNCLYMLPLGLFAYNWGLTTEWQGRPDGSASGAPEQGPAEIRAPIYLIHKLKMRKDQDRET